MNGIEPNDLSLGFVEALYADFLRDPASVSEDWARYFRELPPDSAFRARPQLGPARPAPGLFSGSPADAAAAPASESGERRAAVLQDRVDQMVRAYRVRGHLFAQIDPLGL